jgi:maltooligosyltrehalose trehalohydrolase
MQYSFGPLIDATGATFRLWAPGLPSAELLFENRDPLTMSRGDAGIWSRRVDGVAPGTRYMFRVDGRDVPDPASRLQAEDADSWSVLYNSLGVAPRIDAIRPWHETVLCEVHVGTVTREGTFRALAERLEHFRDAGYTGLELMPIAEFPGARNWGYDGVLLFAPDRSYGTPEDFRALVDRAHELGLSIVLDVVYNHFGTWQNAIAHYAPEFFDAKIHTPWGSAIDFTQPMVRNFYYENACWWLSEYDVDGLRLDAVHEIYTDGRDLFLGELARSCRTAKPGAQLIIENVRNQMHWLKREDTGEPRDFTAQWNDDYHHVMHFLVTGEARNGYDDLNRDPVADLEKSLADGFVHDGDAGGNSDGRSRNEPASELPMEAFVVFLQNHDQIGNRPDARRIVSRLDAHRLDFGHFVTMLNPQIPLFFMGEEAHLRRRFPFFVDLPEPYAGWTRDGRYEQMRGMFGQPVEDGGLPDPTDPATFASAKLDWSAFDRTEHREALARFRELAAVRREIIWPLTGSKCLHSWSARQGNGVIVTWVYEMGTYNMVLNPTAEPGDLEIRLGEPAASTGTFQRIDGGLRLGPWSALVWRS